MRRRLYAAAEARASQQKEARLTLHWRAHISVEEEFDSGHFQFLTCHCCGKLGIFREEEFLSDPSIGFLSSSKSKFRDQPRNFWLGKTLGKSNPNLTPYLKNPKILKLVVLVHLLYLDIGEGSRAEIFKGQRKNPDVPCVKISSSYSLYSWTYDSSKSRFQPLLGLIPKHDT